MPNTYVPQPIAVHEVQARQHFRGGDCGPYQNIYLRTGSTINLPDIAIKRPTDGLEMGVSLWTVNDLSSGAMTDAGYSITSLDSPVDSVEMYVFDGGAWDLPSAVADGYYYLRFSTGPGAVWWSDEIYIQEAGADGFPVPCNGETYVKLRWRQPQCIYTGKSSTDDTTDILAYPPGLDFFIFMKAAALIDAEWERDTKYKPTGSGKPIAEKRFAMKRWKLKGTAVSEGIVDAMRSSAFFDFADLYYADLTEPYFNMYDIIVEASTPDNGCSYDYDYTFVADYLLKQGCC